MDACANGAIINAPIRPTRPPTVVPPGPSARIRNNILHACTDYGFGMKCTDEASRHRRRRNAATMWCESPSISVARASWWYAAWYVHVPAGRWLNVARNRVRRRPHRTGAFGKIGVRGVRRLGGGNAARACLSVYVCVCEHPPPPLRICKRHLCDKRFSRYVMQY